MGVTIKDISKAAGVSIASVSNVLNGNYGFVSESTKNKILKIAKELNYKPNRLARGLVKNKTNIIGLIITDIANPFFGELAKWIENKADSFGYNLILCNTNDDKNKVDSYVDVLIEYSVDGVIVTGDDNFLSKHILQLKDFNIPLVSIDLDLGNDVYSVNVGNLEGSFIATEHMIKNGHRNIAFIGGEGTQGSRNLRLDGYLKALRQYDIPVNYDLIKIGNYQMETGYLYAKLLIENGKKFSAIVCGNDLIAFGAMNAIKDKGLKVPRDVSLIGYDDIFLTTIMDPRLTSIKQPLSEISSYAVEVLVKLINKEEVEEKVKYVTPKLVERESVRNLNAEN